MAELAVERCGEHVFVGRNERGAAVRIGRKGAPGSFTPGELLQIATAGCAAVTVEELVTRRAGDDAQLVAVAGHQRSADGREYETLSVALKVDPSFLDEATRERVIRAMRSAVAGQCTVSRTVERGAPVHLSVEPLE